MIPPFNPIVTGDEPSPHFGFMIGALLAINWTLIVGLIFTMWLDDTTRPISPLILVIWVGVSVIVTFGGAIFERWRGKKAVTARKIIR
jgi:hypothetical protein